MAAPQLNFLTLACADVEQMAEFLRALGWTEDAESEPAHRLFQGTNGIVVALYGAQNYERAFGPRTDGFRGFTLGVNLPSAEEVDRVYELLQGIDGAELLEGAVRLAARLPRLQPPRPRGEHLGRRLETRLDRHARRRPDLVLDPGYTGRRPVAGSSNGRTPDSGSGSWGSNPCPAASRSPAYEGPYALRLTVRSSSVSVSASRGAAFRLDHNERARSSGTAACSVRPSATRHRPAPSNA